MNSNLILHPENYILFFLNLQALNGDPCIYLSKKTLNAILRFMKYYPYTTFHADTLELARLAQAFAPQHIVAVARGALMLGQCLCYALNVRELQSIQVQSYDDTDKRGQMTLVDNCSFREGSRVLLVDDICDSGDTLKLLIEHFKTRHPGVKLKTATLFTKSSASVQPDFSLKEATEWIEFFWERDYQLIKA